MTVMVTAVDEERCGHWGEGSDPTALIVIVMAKGGGSFEEVIIAVESRGHRVIYKGVCLSRTFGCAHLSYRERIFGSDQSAAPDSLIGRLMTMVVGVETWWVIVIRSGCRRRHVVQRIQ